MITIINNKRGIALIAVYMIVTVLLVLLGAYYWRSFNESRFAQRERDEAKAYYIAEAGLAKVAMEIYHKFNSPYNPPDPRPTRAEKAWEDTTATQNKYREEFEKVVEEYKKDPGFPADEEIESGTELRYTVILPSNPYLETDDGVLLRLIAKGEVVIGKDTPKPQYFRRKIASTISYEMRQSPIFNYGYFVNNFGVIDGKKMTINSDVRSNANFSLRNRPTVNGDIYAAENPLLEAAGTVGGDTLSWDISIYQSDAPANARPTNPTGAFGSGGEVYDAGYDGMSERYEHQGVLDMPYLGDLKGYERLAQTKNGQITQGDDVLVNKVYAGNGPDDKKGTPDDGCIVLIGTDKEPIVVNGPVFVKGDVIIKGWVQGQGAIYAGRNIHVLADIEYAVPPSWPKPDLDPYTTAQTNQAKDFVGLAAKGNVIIGDYTLADWKNKCENLLGHNQGYEIDQTDVPLGYDSYPDDGRLWFNGDYTAWDDGYKNDGTERKFYESSLSNEAIHSYAVTTEAPGTGKKPKKRKGKTKVGEVTLIDGVTYNNHALAGAVGADKRGYHTFNGSIATRNELIVYKGSMEMNYDVRAHSRSIDSINIYLPRSLNLPETRTRQSG